jgi:hypothetical protein
MRLSERIADRVDLAIDFLTLGQYGLEEISAPDAGCEGGGRADHGRAAGRPFHRRGGAAAGGSSAARLRQLPSCRAAADDADSYWRSAAPASIALTSSLPASSVRRTPSSSTFS